MTQQKQQKQNSASDSVFGLLASSLIGPAFGAGVSEMWQTAEMASDIYTDRYAAQQKNKAPSFELGAKNALGGFFSRSASGQAPAMTAKAEPADSLYYHKQASLQMQRRHAPRLAA